MVVKPKPFVVLDWFHCNKYNTLEEAIKRRDSLKEKGYFPRIYKLVE